MADTKFENDVYTKVQGLVGLYAEESDYILDLIDRDIDMKEIL